MDWSSALVQWLDNLLWDFLGFWGELIAGESGSSTPDPDSDWFADQSGANASVPNPFTDSNDSAAGASAPSFTGQGNRDAYNAINFASVYADSSLSQPAQLLAPAGLMNPTDATSTTSDFDIALADAPLESSRYLAQNGATGTPTDQNTAADYAAGVPRGSALPDSQTIDFSNTIPGAGWQGTINGQNLTSTNVTIDGTQRAQYYVDGVLVYQQPLGPSGPVQPEAGTLAQAIAPDPAPAPQIFSDPSYTATTFGTAPITTPAPPANAIPAPPNTSIAPGGYAIARPPPVSPQGTYNFLPPQFAWTQFEGAARDMSDPNNPLWARGLLYGLGVALSPLALFEEGLRDAINAVSDTGIRAGENMARASAWWQQGGYGDAAEDALFAIAEEATAFVGAVQILQPVASAVQRAIPAGVRGAVAAGEAALGSEMDEIMRINDLFGEKVKENAALMREALAQGDDSLLEQWLTSREFSSYQRGEMQAANVGKAIERMVAADLRLDSATSKYFAWVAGPSRADFFGVGAAEGFFWDVTTEEGIVGHELESQRWYAPRTFVWGYTLTP
jgi:hypothetical protein